MRSGPALERTTKGRARTSAQLRVFAEYYGAPDPESAMRIACRTLLDHCGAGDKLPIPLRPICRRLGIQVVRRRALGTGTLRSTNGRLEVWLSADSANWRRERFTIAHEIAHVLVFSSWSAGDGTARPYASHAHDERELESLCNLGAAELLMPAGPLAKSVAEHGISPEGLRILYDACLVSFETMLYRLAEITPSSAVILWRKFARRPSEAEKLRVVTSYQRYRTSIHAPWLPKGCTAKHVHPDIVTPAFEERRTLVSSDLVLSLARREIPCIGVCTVLPAPRTDGSLLPLFEGMRIVDERLSEVDAVLLVANRTMNARPLFLVGSPESSTC